MKFFVAACFAFSISGLAMGTVTWSQAPSRPHSTDLTRYFSKLMERLLNTKQPWVARYKQHLGGILQETPLPLQLTPALFVGVQFWSGGLCWLWLVCAYPGLAVLGLPVCLVLGGWGTYTLVIQQQKKFHSELLKTLPGCLDLWAVVLESGSDLGAGIQQYVLKGQPGPLRNLMKELQNDIYLGVARTEAFARLGQRTSFAPLKDVCRGIIQALRLGTRLGPFLNRQAQSLRMQRLHIAEKKAAEAPLKILFPLFVFIFPTIFIVLLGPLVLLFSKGGF